MERLDPNDKMSQVINCELRRLHKLINGENLDIEKWALEKIGELHKLLHGTIYVSDVPKVR